MVRGEKPYILVQGVHPIRGLKQHYHICERNLFLWIELQLSKSGRTDNNNWEHSRQ